MSNYLAKEEIAEMVRKPCALTPEKKQKAEELQKKIRSLSKQELKELLMNTNDF